MLTRRTGAQDADGGNDDQADGPGSPGSGVRGEPMMRFRSFVLVAAAALLLTVVQPSLASAGSGGSGAPKLSLPWSDGVSWRLTGGPHSNVGRGRPWSSLDFAGPIAGRSYPVAAAASGYVVRPCANWVQIRHGNGWETSYYHLIHIDVRAGQYVKQ